jgi:probable phosphoglycerate mutase
MLPHLVFFIRHGETDWNVAARYQGQTDVPLNARGRGQAARNGRVLREILAQRGLDPEALDYVASPLCRAAETMTIVRRELGLEPDAFRREPRLMECNYGRWEGMTLAEAAAAFPDAYALRGRDPIAFTPEGGESYVEVCDRALAVLNALDRPAVVVAHGGLGKAVRGRLLGLSSADTMALPAPQDLIHVIEDGRIGTV